MSEATRDNQASRSKSTSSNVLNSILNGRMNREGSKTPVTGSKDERGKKRSQQDNSKLNRSTDKSRLNANADTSVLSNKGSAAGKVGGKTGGAGVPKGVSQLKHVKDILNAYKSNMQDKKMNESATGASPNGRTSGNSRQAQTGNSSSVSKLNTSLDRSRNGQRSVDLKKKLASAAGLKNSTSNVLKKATAGGKKDALNTSSSVASDLLNRTANNGLKVSKTGTTKPKTATGSKMLSSKSATKMQIGLGSKFGRTLDTKTEEDLRKDTSHIGTESTKDYSRKTHKESGNTSKGDHRSGVNGASSNSRPNRGENNRSRHQESDESPMQRNSEDNDDMEQDGAISAREDEAQDFKKKPVNKNAHRLASLVTQVKPGHMFNESSKKQIDIDKEIKKIHTPRGDEEIHGVKRGEIIHRLDSQDIWKAYYVKNLIEHLKNEDDAITMVKIYKEHFYQTVQSILFLQNVEKIDDNLLVEKKVYLPPNILKRKTLILDLDETLVHCNETLDVPHDHKIKILFANGDEVETGINIRPYAVEFLKEMSEVYEVMIFTASHSCYANVVLNILDPHNEFITYRLFRDQCLQTNEGIFIKDLRIIANRSLSNMLIVDNATYSFGFQLENGIPIVPFYDCPDDRELVDLMHYLRRLALEPDVRDINNKMFMYELISHYCTEYEKLIDIVCSQPAS